MPDVAEEISLFLEEKLRPLAKPVNAEDPQGLGRVYEIINDLLVALGEQSRYWPETFDKIDPHDQAQMAACFDALRPRLSKQELPADFPRVIFDYVKQSTGTNNWDTDFILQHEADAVVAGLSIVGITWAARTAALSAGADALAVVEAVGALVASRPKLQITLIGPGLIRAITDELPSVLGRAG